MAPCRLCGTTLRTVFADLGMSPLSNSFLSAEELASPETFYPLKSYVCEECFLVQLLEYEKPSTIFDDYAYFSSFSDTWLRQAASFAESASNRFRLTPDDLVIEAASNDGYLLQFFKERRVPVLGIDPARNVAKVANDKGITTNIEFFGARCAARLRDEDRGASLFVANNVLAHVPDLHDFVEGIRIILRSTGVATIEVPDLSLLMKDGLFDTIYHEHFSYFSFTVLVRLFGDHGLKIFDVESLDTHGGSLRIYLMLTEAAAPETDAVRHLLERDGRQGLNKIDTYTCFQARIEKYKRELLELLIGLKNDGALIAGYGAPAKASTLLNFSGVRQDLINFTVDRNPYKQRKYIPGVRIPIEPVEALLERNPDYIVIFPWNLAEEVVTQLKEYPGLTAKFIIPLPTLRIVE